MSIGANFDKGRDDNYFQVDVFIPKATMNFDKHNNLPTEVNQSISKHINLLLPNLVNYNMELFAVGSLNANNVTEYVILFKPWLISDVDMGKFTPYIENFIYAVPYRILTSLLSHGLRQQVFSLNSLKNIRVLKDFDTVFFDELNDLWQNLSNQPVPHIGTGIAEELYKATGQVSIERGYYTAENRDYLMT